MYYLVLEKLLTDYQFKYAATQDVVYIDEYLASLNFNQAQRISPWKVAKVINVEYDAVMEVLLNAAGSELLNIRYDVWHPISSNKIYETLQLSEINSPIECVDEPSGTYQATEDDIYLSFVLKDVQCKDELKKKTAGGSVKNMDKSPQTTKTIEQSPSDLKGNPVYIQHFEGSTISGSNIQTGAGHIAAQSESNVDHNSNQNLHKNWLSLFFKHPIISGLLVAVLSALIMFSLYQLAPDSIKPAFDKNYHIK